MKTLSLLLFFLFSSYVFCGPVYHGTGIYPSEYTPEVGGDSEFTRPEGTEMIGTVDESTSSEEETTTKKWKKTTTTSRTTSSESSSSSSEEVEKKKHHISKVSEVEIKKTSHEKKKSSEKLEEAPTHRHLGSELERFGDTAAASAEHRELRHRIHPLFSGSIDTRGNLVSGEKDIVKEVVKETKKHRKHSDEDPTSEYERLHGKEHGDSSELDDSGKKWRSVESEDVKKKKKHHHHKHHSSEDDGKEGTITSLGEFGNVEKVDEKKVTSDAVSLIKEVLDP